MKGNKTKREAKWKKIDKIINGYKFASCLTGSSRFAY